MTGVIMYLRQHGKILSKSVSPSNLFGFLFFLDYTKMSVFVHSPDYYLKTWVKSIVLL